MKRILACLLSVALLCFIFILPVTAEPWRPENPADYRLWQSEFDGMRFDASIDDLSIIHAIDLTGRIKDISTCTKAPVSVYRIAYDGELVLCTRMLFSLYESGVLIPLEREDIPENESGIYLLDAEEFILRSDSGMLFDDVDEISFTLRDYFHGLKELYYDPSPSIPLLREPMLEFPLSESENIDELYIDFCYLYGPAFPALFDDFDKTKTVTIDVCLGDEVVRSLTVVPTAFDSDGAYMTVRLQGEGSVNLHNLECYEKKGDADATASHYLYSYRLHVPEGLLLCGAVKNDASVVNDVCCVSISTREMLIDLPGWFSFARKIAQSTHIPFLRNALEKAASFALMLARPSEANDLMQSYKDIGGTQNNSAAEIMRTLLF